MLIGLISDTHVGMKANNETMLKASITVVDEIIKLCLDRGCKLIIHLGDFFDDRQTINVKSQEIGQLIIEKFEEAGIDFILIGGNHDFYYKRSKRLASINMFKRHNIHLITKPKHLTFDNVHFLAVPWLSSEEEITAFTEFAMKEGHKYICLGHFDIKGYWNNDYHQSYTGIDPEVVRHFKKVYSGHFHKRQSDGNVTYVGSTIQKDHGETEQEKGITFLSTQDLSEDFQEFKNIPKHHTIVCDNDLLKSPTSVLNKKYSDIIEGNFIRLNILGFHDEEMIARVEMELLRRKALDVKRNFCLVMESDDIDLTGEMNGDVELVELGNPMKLHMKYIERDEFLKKFSGLYDIKLPVLRKILHGLYEDVYTLRGEDIYD
jgi:DNA repair exonuclease SbcCD nuclease subunit